EVFNAGATTANVGGWYLTDFVDELTKWQFPPVEIGPGGFLLVFASDKDRRRPGRELHANFKLSSGGEYLALVRPDGMTVAWEAAPFPAQVGDFSYGLEQNAGFARLVESAAPARALVPRNGALGLSWTQVGFADSGWQSGRTGAGYDRNTTYRPLINLDLSAEMDGQNTTAYMRVRFTAEDAASIGGFRLRMKYDDGFIAYLNGVRIASANAPGSGSWDSSATTLHDDGVAVVFEEFSVMGQAGLLREGDNVLAIHGLNGSLGSSDFLVMPELDGIGSGTLNRQVRQFFDQPTPGFGNAPGFASLASPARFSVGSTVFSGSLTLTLTTDEVGGVVRLTQDGSEPTSSSPRYTGPLRLTTSTMVRARVYAGESSASPTVTETYLSLASSVRNFSSDIPVVVVDNFGGGSVPSNNFQPAFMAIFEPGADGRTRLSGVPELSTRIGIKIRGSSTLGRPKKAYTLEAWDEKNEDKNIEPLGLPRESDWILYGAYNFDRALMRNAFVYELSNLVGRWAARTRFCEVYVNTGGGSLTSSDYVGVYSFMEKIKRDPNRVDVERLTASFDREPEITGGYMLKIDRPDPGDSGFGAAGQTIRYVYPKERNISSAQATWLRNYMNSFASALNGASFRDPVRGYARYVDVPSWIDHHILNVLPMNVDALRLSAYFFKKRGGKIEFGPIWDFDRSMGSTDGRDDNPRTWVGGGDATRFFDYPWWGRLFDDQDFWQAWIDRWQELRQVQLSTQNIDSVIDVMAQEINESQRRNFQKWRLGGPGFLQEINILKNWLRSRATWIDSRFVRAPTLSSRGRRIDPGFQLTVTAPRGTIYTTLDGTDPRRRGGAVAPGATRYTGPITLDDNARVVARARVTNNDWSGRTVATFVVTTPRLVITEIMYHPPDGPLGSPYDDNDYEFVEVMNAAGEAMDVGGARFVDGIEFTFPDVTLQPGELALVVRNEAAFESRYGAGLPVLGEYTGRLENRGERMALLGPLEEPILAFNYLDAWYPTTDGQGDSLTIIDPFAPLTEWGVDASWGPSSVIGGTPGEEDTGLGSLGGRQRPGDANQDGVLDLSDSISLLRRLFLGSPAELPCDGATLGEGGNSVLLDANGDGGVDLSDAVHVLSYLFQNGPEPLGGTACVRIEGCPTACGF
ncbi:MAG: CotH kinase family protein, partial [Planctomycetota bacterium]|nr:CotH kinase family protein [Planctomycetota bacterium]